ncbi:clathrin interactor EPSIN 1 [Striga asiatica]|uniref:Clathrin interactor EPSIN 1 n=1 Tax=Striga asiatica TaxID=4170 RepID=A0A5A7PIQ7_STRAF|nr:clathrin interactor EPSIN 1 [Striga asiatica]
MKIAIQVLDATDDEPWGPHGTVLAEIAGATKKFNECQIVMDVLWTRLTETGRNWRFVYKALTVIEYLVANGSERALDDVIEHTFQISSLTSFEYVEPSGKDVGLNVRKKAETIVRLLNDKDKIQQVRDKAAANREKYFGVSSSEITYKSGAASFSSSNFRNSDRYGGFGNSDTSYDSYKGKSQFGEDIYEKKTKSEKEPSYYSSKKQDSTKTGQLDKNDSVSSKADPSDKYDEDFDDFDPRGTSSSKPSAGSYQVDLFGENFVDLLDAPVSVSTDKSTSLHKDPSEVDLFANADFVSATPEPEPGKIPMPVTNIDLFANQPVSAVPSNVDFFSMPEPVNQLDNEPSKPDTTTNTLDPFAPVPHNDFDRPTSLGPITSQMDPLSTAFNKNPPNDESRGEINESLPEAKSPPKKAFQCYVTRKEVIEAWEGELQFAKKVNLADVGIVGGLTDGSEGKDKGSLPSFYTGSAMGVVSGAGKSAFVSTSTSTSSTNDDFFSGLSSQQYRYGGFQK